MLIDSAVFGELEIDESQIFSMPNGLFGFEGIDRYALITKEDDGVELKWFQSVSSRVPCFVVFDPYDIITGFQPELENGDLKALKADRSSPLRYLVLAVVPEDITKTTVNLKSPLVINEAEHIARQVILRNDYPIRFPLAESLNAEEPALEAVL